MKKEYGVLGKRIRKDEDINPWIKETKEALTQLDIRTTRSATAILRDKSFLVGVYFEVNDHVFRALAEAGLHLDNAVKYPGMTFYFWSGTLTV